ncbi:methyltransferase domain-containing protein [Ornithinimicrobium cryptoxanthini]
MSDAHPLGQLSVAQVMQCDYFDAGRCRSCSLMGTDYAGQLADKQSRAARALAAACPGLSWEAPFGSVPEGFRNKAKLVVGGTRDEPTAGILDAHRQGVDLRHCGLYEPGLAEVVEQVPEVIATLGLVPYDVVRRSGELKHVLLTHSPDGELMIRFVLRSPGQQVRIARALPWLLETIPGLRVVSVNLQPDHAAVLEGPEEIVLTVAEDLPMQVNEVRLRLRTGSFFQTNTTVAAGLYRQAQDWIHQVDPVTLWDLYCGVGGFALHALLRPDGTPRDVLGLEISSEAVASARTTAAELPGAARFEVGDAASGVGAGEAGPLRGLAPPDLVVVNPPRRGIGPVLTEWLESSQMQHVLYSSCNVDSLARDLERMPSLVPVRARLFDMFPQTPHLEVLTLLRRG